MMTGGIVGGVIDAQNQGDIGLGGRGRDQNLLGSADLDVLDGVGALSEEAGGFDDHGDAEVFPRKPRDISLSQNLDFFSVDDQGVALGGDFALEGSEDGVVFQQVGQGLGVRDVVDGRVLDGGVIDGCSKHVPADAAESVDADSNAHEKNLLKSHVLRDECVYSLVSQLPAAFKAC
jgi:hypothetical protein